MDIQNIFTIMHAYFVVQKVDWFGFVDNNGVFFNYPRDFNAAMKTLKESRGCYSQRGNMAKRAVTGDIRLEIEVCRIPFICYFPKKAVSDSPVPPECYRIRLTTPDPEGEAV